MRFYCKYYGCMNRLFKNSINLILLGFLLALTKSCNQSSEKTYQKVDLGFYYWQNSMNHSQFTQIKEKNPNKVYLKVFEVHPHSYYKAVPKAKFQLEEGSYYSHDFIAESRVSFIPVIYLENATFDNISKKDTKWLAEKVKALLKDQWRDLGYNYDNPLTAISEVQFDCDWTNSTQSKYFRFIDQFKQLSQIPISTTINLYHLKYPEKAGVPPVSRAMLMYYNMGNIADNTTSNSILNNEIGQKYIREGMTYPLPLDFALPIFSWAVHYRLGNYKGIRHDLNEAKLSDMKCFQQTENQNRYVCQKDTVVGGTYYRYKDVIRMETISKEALMRASNILRKIDAPTASTTLTFFHWKTQYSSDHEAKLKSVYHCFINP